MFAAPARRKSWILGSIALVTVVSFAYGSLLVGSDPSAAFFVAGSRAWELGIGAMLALLLPSAPRTNFIGGVIAWIGLTMIAGAYVWIHSATRFPEPGALLPSTGFCLNAKVQRRKGRKERQDERGTAPTRTNSCFCLSAPLASSRLCGSSSPSFRAAHVSKRSPRARSLLRPAG